MEMMGVIAGITVMIGLGITTINGLFRLEKLNRQTIREGAALDRLAEAFRDDLHAARRPERGATPAPGPVSSLSIARADGVTVEYRADGRVLVVTRSAGDAEPRVERVSLTTLGTPRLAWEDEAGRLFARLSFVRDGAAESRTDLRIMAALGRDHVAEPAEDQP
jgi:hypothetical protein